MTELLRTLVTMSLTGGVIAAILLIAKPVTKKRLPKAAGYYLWLAVFAALLIPFSKLVVLPPDAPAVAPINDFVTAAIRPASTPREERAWEPPNMEYTIPATHQQATPSSVALAVTPVDWQTLTPAIPAVSVLILLYTLIGYVRFVSKIKRTGRAAETYERDMLVELCGTRRAPRLYRSAAAATPMLIGLFRPAIILPERDFSDDGLRSVLMHELTHLRRKDIAVKWLSTLACALHWFNPLAWIARRELDRSCELACDEAVIRGMDVYGRQSYGDTLIAVAASNKTPRAVLSTTMIERKQTLKERLGAIMEHKKHTRLAVITSVMLIAAAVLASCALGAGRGAEIETPKSPETSEMPSEPPIETPTEPVVGEPDELALYTETPNPRYGYSVPLPDIYDGKVLFLKDNNDDTAIISVYHEATMLETDFPGWLLEILRYTPAQLEQNVSSILNIGGHTPFAKDDDYYYMLLTPTDVQSLHEEYRQLSGEISQIMDDFIEANNLETYSFWRSAYTDPYSFPGNHIYLDVTLINNTKFHIAMSQPVRQGEGGVWCVDRIYFASGNRDVAIPKTELTMTEYYAAKQVEADADPSRLQTPEDAARQYLEEVWGWSWEIESMIFAGMYDPADIPAPQYTDAEIADARAVVDAYFAAMNAHDEEAFNELWTPPSRDIQLSGLDAQFADIEIRPETTGRLRDSYLRNGGGAFNGTLPGDCIVFECDFTVDGDNLGAWDKGRVTGWGVYLIRADAASPWMIDDNGR